MISGEYVSNDNILQWYNAVDDIPIVVIRSSCGYDSTERRLKKLSDRLGIQHRSIYSLQVLSRYISSTLIY